MEIKRKSWLKWVSRGLILAIFFAGILGLRNVTSINANEGSNYSLELVDGDYADSGVIKVKLTVHSGKKETLKLRAEGTSFLDPESFVEDLNTELQSAIDVGTTSDDNVLELKMTGESQTFSTVFEANIDRSQQFSEGKISLESSNGETLGTVSFDQLDSKEVSDEESDQADASIQEETASVDLASSRMISSMSLALPTPSNPVDVSTWAELSAALSSTTVDWINLKADITSGAAVTVTRSKVINGNDNGTIRRWDSSTRVVTLGSASAGSQMTLSDVTITGNSATAMFNASTANSGSWEVQLDNVSNLSTNAQPLANLRDGKVLITGTGNLAMTRSANYINVKTLVVTDNAVIDAQLANTFYETTVDASSVTVEGGSKLTVYSATDNVIRSSGQVDFTFKGQGTEVDFSGSYTTSGSGGGLVSINNDNSNINVLDGAYVSVRSLAASSATPAIMMMSRGGIFTVDGGSKLYLESGSNTNNLSSVLRFRSRGYMTFDVKNNSTIEINRTGGNSAALRMYGDGNVVNVSSGSDVILTNEGSGTPLAPGGDGRNQGVHYDSGSTSIPSEFNLTGENSAVTIDADYGAAIDGNGSATNIVAGAGTYFVARGRTPGANEAIFAAGSAPITVTMDHPKYFDFRNDRPGGGNVFQGTAASVFTLNNSMLAVWENGRNLDGNPSKSWTVMDSVWTGVNFANGTSSNNPEFNSSFLGAPAYSRMTANNQAAVIDELRVPTDADKYIWGHASVPEGKMDDPRDAYTDEVHVRVEVYNGDGSFAYEAVGSSIGDGEDDDGIAVYGDDERAGIFKINVPNGEFLTSDQTIKVIAAWRGLLENEGTSLVYDSEASDLQTPERIVLDVTPPEPTALTDENLNNVTKVLSGENAEKGALVHVYYNSGDRASGTLLGTTTVQPDGSWSFNLPYYVEKTKELSVYLSDDAGQHTAAQVVSAPGETPVLYDQTGLVKPPVTNISTGNINPYNDYAYHDAV
ncbi:pectate lyase-like adhesive domain-containing protein, partial [Enterococcus larvae]|uniref:pectate lyase-like adhesive domain-containing protein n=1 Tax=Enterococcus larvae TaxID=2794352 RepID=UPI003F397D9D